MDNPTSINLPAGKPWLAAVVATQLFGSLWYSPYLFGTRWAHHAYPGRSMSEIGEGFMSIFIIGLLLDAAIVVLLFSMGIFEVSDAYDACMASLLLGGFHAFLDLIHAQYQRRDIQVWAIDITYDMIKLCIMTYTFIRIDRRYK